MSAMGWWRRPAMPGTRRAARQRAVLQARLTGQYGPQWWEIAPVLAGLALGIGLPVGGVWWLYVRLGVGGLVLGLVVLAAVLVPLVQWRRAVGRRRAGVYLAPEITRFNRVKLVEATARMLRRDGWAVRSEPWQGTPRLLCKRDEVWLDVTFREPAGEDDAAAGPAPLREALPGGLGDYVRLVVTTGSFPRGDVLWANRQGGVHLLDGHQLQQWAAGTPLTLLIGLSPSDAA